MAQEPNRVGSAAKWVASVGGAIVIVAIQTPPDVAASNAALWVQKVTGYLPDWPQWVDVLATGLGVLLLLTPLIVRVWRKWRDRPGTIDDWLRSLKQPNSPALSDEDLAAGIGSKAARRRQRPSPQPSVWDVIEARTPPDRPTLLDHMIEGKIGTPQDELTRKAAARTAYEMRKLTGGIGDPIAFGARLLDEDAKNAEKLAAERTYNEELAKQRAAIRAKAQLMHDRLASRNHSYGHGRAGLSDSEDSYLAALWDAEQRGECYDDYHRSTFPPPPPNRWEMLSRVAKLMGVFEMPLRDVVRRVAFDSKWAIRWDRTNALALTGQPSAPKWQVDLKAEVLRQLCTLRSRGTYQEAGEKPHNGVDPIPLDFWQEADFDVIDMLVSDLAGIAFIPGKYGYRDVKLDAEDIDRIWPKRGKRALKERPSPFLEWVEPWRDQADYRAAFNERAWDIGVAKEGDARDAEPASRARLRALIAKGRDVVHRWRRSDRSLGFEIFASQDRDYLDVQPYLGDEYQAERSQRGSTAASGDDVEDYYAGQLLRELARLEKKWGLV